MITIGKTLKDIRTARCGVIPYLVVENSASPTPRSSDSDLKNCKPWKPQNLSRDPFNLKDMAPNSPGSAIHNCSKSKSMYSIYFLMAKHKKTGELSDFGGGVKKIETAIEGGFREFCEESRDIFADIYKVPSDMFPCITLVDDKKIDMAEIFVPVDNLWLDEAIDAFNNVKNDQYIEEISDVVWLSQESFSKMISDGTDGHHIIWKRIQNFLKRTLKNQSTFYNCLNERARILTMQG